MTPHPDDLQRRQEAMERQRRFAAMQRRHEQAYPRRARLRDALRPMLLATTSFKHPILNS